MGRRCLGIMIIMSGKGRCLNLIALANRNRKINSVSADRRADQKLLCIYKKVRFVLFSAWMLTISA